MSAFVASMSIHSTCVFVVSICLHVFPPVPSLALRDRRQFTLDKTVGSRVWRHTQGSSKRPALDLGWRSSSKTAPGSLSTGSPAGRTPLPEDGSMYSQAYVRGGWSRGPPAQA